ncbi:MAG: twin-arginine translocase TatA/TatE family subunit [Firmicutes bacterium]|nr:twin-arginine translocase TatA/TatE family subunit [Bacillota bacterium]
MFPGIGVPELVLILVIALIIFGPGRLPEIGRALGQAIRSFKGAMNDIERVIDEEGGVGRGKPQEPQDAAKVAHEDHT